VWVWDSVISSNLGRMEIISGSLSEPIMRSGPVGGKARDRLFTFHRFLSSFMTV